MLIAEGRRIKNRIGSRRVQFAIGLISDEGVSQNGAGLKLQVAGLKYRMVRHRFCAEPKGRYIQMFGKAAFE